LLVVWALGTWETAGQTLRLPTANQAIFERGGMERYFVPTPGKGWDSGTFGAVRSEGWQMHEGIDIKCVQRNRRGQPLDPIMAVAPGTVVYLNPKPSLSNYGIYVLLRHQMDGLEVYSLYAHLSEIRRGLRVGQAVRAGETIGIMGCTSNTRERISLDRAHLHFELDLFLNDRFSRWYQAQYPKERNDHGQWNGQNLVGLDPRLVFLVHHRQGKNFNLLNFTRNQTELCRVAVRQTDFPWLRRYAALVQRNPTAEKEGVAGYEIKLNFNGLPFQLTPRAASELTSQARFQLLSVNGAEQEKNPARRLVHRNGGHWELGTPGLRWLELLTY
jgi:murein DD-endopeptidase MepM/ murein hydrolase activator NlpD